MLNGVARFRQPHLVLEKRSSRKRREEEEGVDGRTGWRRRGARAAGVPKVGLRGPVPP